MCIRDRVSAAEHSVGSKEAPEAARIELKNLLNDMDVYVSRMEELLQTIEEMCIRDSLRSDQSAIGHEGDFSIIYAP